MARRSFSGRFFFVKWGDKSGMGAFCGFAANFIQISSPISEPRLLISETPTHTSAHQQTTNTQTHTYTEELEERGEREARKAKSGCEE